MQHSRGPSRPDGDYGGPIFRDDPDEGARRAAVAPAPTPAEPASATGAAGPQAPPQRGAWQGYSKAVPGEDEVPLRLPPDAHAPAARRAVPRAGRSRAPLFIGVVAVLLVVGVLAAVTLLRGDRAASSRPAVTASDASPGAGQSSPLETPGSEAAALAELETLAAADLAAVPRSNQYVAQLASKHVGISDPRQTATNGTHTFYAIDILAEHRALRDRLASVQVVLLRSSEYGLRRTHDGQPYWVTMALSPDFGSGDEVRAWCRGAFPDLAGAELTNSCMVNRLAP